MVVQRITSCSKKKKWKIFFFPKKEKKKKKKKRNLISKKKKKIILFQNPVLLNYVLTWSSIKEVRRQPFKGPVPITQITLENKFKTMWQNCLGACYAKLICFASSMLKLGALAYLYCVQICSRMKACFHLRHQSIFLANMSTLRALAKNVFLIIGF